MNLYYFSSGPRERVLSAILNAGHNVLKIFITNPDKYPKIRPTMELAKNQKIPLKIVKKSELLTLAEEIGDSICLSVGFAYLFPETLLKKITILNVHGSLLPHYAGYRTLNWIIARGEKESGVTIHKIDAGIDTGPILLQRKFGLTSFDTGASLYRKMLSFEPQVVVEALSLYNKGEFQLINQTQDSVVQFPNRMPAHSEIDPQKPLIELLNEIRASDPVNFPAHFYLNGEKVCIKLWRPHKPIGEEDLI